MSSPEYSFHIILIIILESFSLPVFLAAQLCFGCDLQNLWRNVIAIVSVWEGGTLKSPIRDNRSDIRAIGVLFSTVDQCSCQE